jgi:ABC-type hemin transport system substrate-binding protein
VGQGAAAAPVVFLLAVTLEPEPLDPAYRSVTNPIGLQALRLPIAVTDVVAALTAQVELVAADVEAALELPGLRW